MKVFISWSGERSRQVASALRNWLPTALPKTMPFVSSTDIHAGSQWQVGVADELDSTDFGVICVTAANHGSRWLNFEAGALAMKLGMAHVVPLAIDLKVSDIAAPLGQFQAKTLSFEGMVEVVAAMDSASMPGIGRPQVERAVRNWWPALEKDLAILGADADAQVARERGSRELLEEIPNNVRAASLHSSEHSELEVVRLRLELQVKEHEKRSEVAQFRHELAMRDNVIGFLLPEIVLFDYLNRRLPAPRIEASRDGGLIVLSSVEPSIELRQKLAALKAYDQVEFREWAPQGGRPPAKPIERITRSDSRVQLDHMATLEGLIGNTT